MSRPEDPSVERAPRSPSAVILSGASLLTLASVFGRLLSIPAAAYLTRRLGPGPYGTMALVGTTASLAAAAGLMGLDVGYARYGGAGSKLDAEGVERSCWRRALAGGLLTGVGGAIVYALLRQREGAGRWGGAVAGAVVMMSLFSVASVLATTRRRIEGAYSRIAMAGIAGGVVGVGLNVVLAWIWRQDEWPLIVGTVSGVGLQLLLLGIPVTSLRRGPALPPSLLRSVVQVGIAATATAPAYWVISSSDRWMIALLSGEAAAGIYSFAAQFGLMAQLVTAAVGATWLTEVVRAARAGGPDASIELGLAWERVSALFLVAWLGISLFGPLLIRILAAPVFHAGTIVVAPIAAGALLNGFVQFGFTGLVMANSSARAILPSVCCALFSVLANLWAIPRFGWQAAGFTNMFTFAVLALWLTILGRKSLGARVRWRRIGAGTAVAAVGVLLATALPEGRLSQAVAIRTVVMALAGVLVLVLVEGRAGIVRRVGQLIERGIEWRT